MYSQFQYIEHKAGLVLCILKLTIHTAGEISPPSGCFSSPAPIVANKQAKTLLISQFLFHFAEKLSINLTQNVYCIFWHPLLYTCHSVQCIRYIIDNGMEKHVQGYFVQFYLYRNIMHVSGEISRTLSKN